MRLDKFLQISKLVKRRAVAHTLCEHGRVRLNGTPAKAAADVHPGDVITLIHGDQRLMAKVVTVPERPRSAKGLVEILGRINLDELRAASRDSGIPGFRD